MRFQPRTGQTLAAASDKVVSIFDVETDRQTYSFQVLTMRYCIYLVIEVEELIFIVFQISII